MRTKYDSKKSIFANPEDVIPFASLCLNYWPYKTGSKIYEYIKYSLCDPEKGINHEMLEIRYLSKVLYENIAAPNYRLCLDNAKRMSLPSKIANAGNLFFIRQNLFEFEEEHRDYREIPPAFERGGDDELCTEKNLASFVSRTIFEMNTGRKPTPDEEQKYSIHEHHLWTWLGPIDPVIPVARTFKPNDEERQAIIEFLAVAKSLNQTDEKCLARMVKYRYPNLSKTEIYDFIYPGNDAGTKQKDSQGTRWGIIEEKRRKTEEPRS